MEKSNPEITVNQVRDESVLRSSDGDDIGYKPPQWPSEPKNLADSKIVKICMNVFDFGLVFMPFVLIAKCILVIVAAIIMKWDGNPERPDRLTSFLTTFNDQLTTAFTILFMTTMATFLKRLALWRAQRGANVATLEQYQASMSLPSTFKTILSLRAFTMTSVGLVAIWSFYYLGSQATSREYVFRTSASYKKFDVYTPNYYTNSGLLKRLNTSTLIGLNSRFIMDITAMDADKTNYYDGGDPEGQALIPDLRYYQACTNKDKHGYCKYDQKYSDNPATYEGLNMFGNDVGNELVGSYQVDASYPYVQCTNFTKPLDDDSKRKFDGYKTPRIFEVFSKYKGGLNHAMCTVHTATVDIKVNCNTRSICTPYSYKPKTENGPEKIGLDVRTPFDNNTFFIDFLDKLSHSTGIPLTNESSTLLEYTWSTASLIGEDVDGLVDLTWNETLDYSTEIAQAVASYHQVGLWYGFDYYSTDNMTVEEIKGNFTTGRMDGAMWSPEYHLSIPWLVVDFISCVLLIIIAVISSILRKRTVAPDIFGYVSSLTRENPNLPLPNAGSALSGMDRARLMKGMKIKISDVEKDSEVGKVSVTWANPTAESMEAKQARLMKQRAYQ